MGSDTAEKVPPQKYARDLLNINVLGIISFIFKGTINLTNMLLPALKKNGRIVNVSSRRGALKLHHK